MRVPCIVVFDLGKVLVDFDYSIAARKFATRGTMQTPTDKIFRDHSELLLRYETGQVTRQEFFDEVRNATGFRGTIEEFGELFADIFTEIPRAIEIHTAVCQHGVPTYIFSNTNDLAIEHVRRNFPFFSHFDGYIFSYQVGAMKPDVKIYEALERMTGRSGAEILYIDDRQENIAVGASRGWQVILHESPEKTRVVFEKLGLL